MSMIDLSFLTIVMLSPTLIFRSSTQFFGSDIMYVDPPLSWILLVCFVPSNTSNILHV